MFSSLQQMSNMFIRPQRYKYRTADLGPLQFQIDNKIVYRIDIDIKNINNYTLKCSIFSTSKYINQIEKAILYLHCNSGCRIQGLTYLKHCIQNNYGLIVFDFAGSGLSQGQIVSLGFHQADDIDCVIKYLKTQNQNLIICLWGRSMGAVAGLRYLQRNHSIIVGVFDSPFSSLRQLAVQIGSIQTKLPKFLVQLFIQYLKSNICKKANFDIDQLNLKQNMKNIKAMGIFISSKNDKLVPYSQVQQLFTLFTQKKQLFIIDEDHNQTRKKQTLDKVFKSINKYMKLNTNNLKNQFRLKVEQVRNKKKIQLTFNITSLNKSGNGTCKSLNIQEKSSQFSIRKKKCNLQLKLTQTKKIMDKNLKCKISKQKIKIKLNSSYNLEKQNNKININQELKCINYKDKKNSSKMLKQKSIDTLVSKKQKIKRFNTSGEVSNSSFQKGKKFYNFFDESSKLRKINFNIGLLKNILNKQKKINIKI